MVSRQCSFSQTARPRPCAAAQARESVKQPARIWAVALLSSLLLAFASLVRQASAQVFSPSQVDIQSVYLFDFAKFVRWPAKAATEPIILCVAGQKVYIDELAKMVSGEHIDAHPLSVRSIEHPENEDGCSVLFIDSTEQDQIEGLLAAAAGKPMLTVSDAPDFLDRGGMIQFLLVDQRVRFSVDLSPVARSGISLNSELLKVAVNVRGNSSGGRS